MRGRFTSGLIAGGIIGAALSMAISPNMSSRTRRRMMRTSRSLIRRSGHVIGDIIDMMR